MLLIFFSNVLIGQNWRSPVNHDIRLSGTFCELRTNHFHHGLDIKSSKGVSGDPINAIGDGKIQRLRVQAAGYGNSIYIEHPEGYVSVYGHLLHVNPTLDSIVKHYQYQAEKFEIDIHCDSLNIHVNKGDQIGRMGSSGYSFGPHLHFEIRDAQTETTLNPLLFGFEIKDNIAPSLTQVRLDYLSTDGRRYGTAIYPVIKNKSSHRIKGDTLYAAAWRCGIALRTIDKMNGCHNRNGIYSAVIYVDSQLVYQFQGDSVRFEDSRGVNLLKDMETYKKSRELWHTVYDLPGSQLPDYLLKSTENGWITAYENQARKVDIELFDYSKNNTSISFFLLRDSNMVQQAFPSYNYHLLYQEPNIIRTKTMELHCPEHAFYRDQYVRLDELADSSQGNLSNVIKMSGDHSPFQSSCRLRMKMTNADSMQMTKAVVLACGGGELKNIGGIRDGDWIECSISGYNEFVVYEDREAPTFELISFPAAVKNGSTIRMKIYDKFESNGSAREVECRAEIDGRWVLVSHDVKSNTFACQMRDLKIGEHEFVIKYWDHAGNEGRWSRTFKIK